MPRLFASLLLLLLASAAHAQPATRPISEPGETVAFFKDVVFGKTGQTELKLDLAEPKVVESPAPCIVVIHGGGWAKGKKEDHDDLVRILAARGYVAVTVGYRLAPDAVFPAQLEDAKCAVRFLRANAKKYNIDPDRIGAVGFSAGAHLSMMLGVTNKGDGMEGDGGSADQSSKVQAVVSFFGPTDLTAAELLPDVSPILSNFLGGSISQKPEAYKKASPINYVRKDCPPMLLIQGTGDPLVHWKQAIRMAEDLSKNGVDGRVELLLGKGHGWTGPELKRTAEETFAFFDEKLAKK